MSRKQEVFELPFNYAYLFDSDELSDAATHPLMENILKKAVKEIDLSTAKPNVIGKIAKQLNDENFFHHREDMDEAKRELNLLDLDSEKASVDHDMQTLILSYYPKNRPLTQSEYESIYHTLMNYLKFAFSEVTLLTGLPKNMDVDAIIKGFASLEDEDIDLNSLPEDVLKIKVALDFN